MNKFERLQELERLRGECLALEEKAQLYQVMERAREGRFIPLGAFGEDASPKEYFADEHDCLREKTRDAYFSVADLYARKALIEAQRKVESRIRQSLEEDVIEANKEVAVASSKTQRLPWGKAALLGVGAVAVGYWVFGMVGAISGAVASFFLGQGVIADARNEANAELAQASDNYEQAKKERAEQSLMPEFFSHREEMSGDRDNNFDDESAYENMLRSANRG